ncbi:MAG: DNRLRE domain-containing protein [Bacteroidales bacterium]|nr:DNRLRE domain-containing protein [Bacteroidales bacterium]
MDDELRALCSAAVEGRLTDAETQRLEVRVRSAPEALRFYTAFLHMHAVLTWNAGGSETHPSSPEPQQLGPQVRTWRRRFLVACTLAACLLVAIFLVRSRDTSPVAFATLTDAKADKWGGGTLPTVIGSRLGTGRLHLVEGLATLSFDNGARVRLEGPAELELVSGSHCTLHGGRLVAKVPPPAIGFVVDTPTAKLIDLGTEFGVNVRDHQTADVQVFNGLVDAQHHATGKIERMPTGQGLTFETNAVRPFDPLMETPPATQAPPPLGGNRSDILTLTTTMGQGQDGYIQPPVETDHRSDVLILVKSTRTQSSNYNRKGYLKIDLTPLQGRKIQEARLTLTASPTGIGFASEVPDATFTVYGLTEESLDPWDMRTMTWANAPAHSPVPTTVNRKQASPLGTFSIPQAVQSGVYVIEGTALVDFLNRDTNGLATFIIVRDTLGSGRQDYVHGFANRNHPTLTPPTLKVTVR